MTMEPNDWKQRIVQLVLVKQKLAEVDTKGLWRYHLPALAATEEKVRAVEARLGEPLDPGYRAFLSHADGWPAFLQTVDLFGTADLQGGDRGRHGAEMLSHVEDVVLTKGGLRREDLLPIAATPVDLDLFVMTKRSAPQPGTEGPRCTPQCHARLPTRWHCSVNSSVAARTSTRHAS
jgi:hypothetical protein